MTTLKIDIRNMSTQTHPDDRVILYAPEVRARIGGGLVSTAPLEVELVDGQTTVENVEPGPLVARFECRGVADTTEKRGIVPDSGIVTLDDVLELKFTWTPPVIASGLQQIIDEMNRAVGTVGGAVDGAMGGLVRSAESAARASAQSSAGSEVFANAANVRAASAETKVNAYTPRVVALELMGGLAPGEPADGQTANLVAQPGTLTRLALDGGYRQRSPASVDCRPHTGSHSEAIEAAVADIPVGGRVLLTSGSGGQEIFSLDSPLVIDKPCVIEGEGEGIVIDVATNGVTAAADYVTFRNVTFRGIGTSDSFKPTEGTNYIGWRFENCRWVGAALDLTRKGRVQYNGVAALFGTGIATGTHVIGCEFTGYAQNYTLEIGGGQDVLVSRSWIHDGGIDVNYGDGIKVQAASVGTRITDCVIENMTRDAIDLYDSYQNVVTGNTLRNCHHGIDAKWRSTDPNFPGRDIIANNQAYDMKSISYNVNSPNCLVIGNVSVRAGYRGFYCGTSVDEAQVPTPSATLVGNQAVYGLGDGFSIGGFGTTVTGNVATDNTGTGFTFSPGGDRPTLTGNTALRNGVRAIGNPPMTAFLSGNIVDDGAPQTTNLLPNGAQVMSHSAAGSPILMMRMNAADTLQMGSASNPLTQLQAGAAVEVVPEMRMRAALRHYGTTAGFFGKAPVSRPTGVAATPEAIHAALASLGLIT